MVPLFVGDGQVVDLYRQVAFFAARLKLKSTLALGSRPKAGGRSFIDPTLIDFVNETRFGLLGLTSTTLRGPLPSGAAGES